MWAKFSESAFDWTRKNRLPYKSDPDHIPAGKKNHGFPGISTVSSNLAISKAVTS